LTLLSFGVLLWSFAHFFKRLFPAVRAKMGEIGRLVVTLLIIAAIALMVIGYRGITADPLYVLPDAVWHLNNVLMLIAIYLVNVSKSPGMLRTKIRHPMLLGFAVWAAAHLLVNGDAPSVVLFGGLGLWALVQMVVISRADGPWVTPVPGPIRHDVIMGVVSVVIYGVIAWVHHWLGVPVLRFLEG